MIKQISKIHEKNNLTIKDRINYLKKFKNTILKYENEIYDALSRDLNKSKKETYLSEISEVISEIEYHIKNINKWFKYKKVKDTYQVMGTKSYIINKPKGKILIISPFNYPINLTFMPLVGAFSAGNNILLKTSPKTKYTNKIIYKIIDESFNKNNVTYIKEEDLKKYNDIYEYNPNMIFFTGSTRIGKIIEKNCVDKNIEFVTELGGKCSCIVNDLNNESIYERIVWAKFMNAGQTCVSINHIYYNKNIDNFKEKLINEINIQYPNPIENKNIPKIISKDDFDRLIKIINKYKNKIIFGGKYDKDNLIIEPTIILCSKKEIEETEEVFGPIIFLVEYDNDIDNVINECNLIDSSPLASYLYSNKKEIINMFIKNINAGGYCINDSMSHILNHNLPFGGVYTSGFGRYHGKYSFDAFSYQKPVLLNNLKKNNKIKYINNEIDLEKTKKLINFVKKFKK